MDSARVLIVRPGALGDTILSLPLVETICSAMPGAAITFLGNRRYQDLFPCSIDFQPFDGMEWLWLFDREGTAPGGAVRAFDLAYVVLAHPEPVARNLRQAGTKNVRHISARPPSEKHLVAHLHESLGFPLPPKFPVLRNLAPRKKRNMIWVHPGSGGRSKCLPLPVMLSLVNLMRAGTGYSVAVTMAEEDAFLAEMPEWDSLVKAEGTVVLKDYSLGDLCKVAGSASMFLGNDSGISHLAAGLGVPSSVFFIRTDPAVWAPWTTDNLLNVVDLRSTESRDVDVECVARKIIAFSLKTRDTPTLVTSESARTGR